MTVDLEIFFKISLKDLVFHVFYPDLVKGRDIIIYHQRRIVKGEGKLSVNLVIHSD